MSERWEYKIMKPTVKGMGVSSMLGGSVDKIHSHYEHELNELGRIGWNCYHIDTGSYPATFYLKRNI